MRFQTRRLAVQSQSVVLPVGQQTSGYPIGTILHGNSNKGNLWIITVDQSYDASLLFEGTTKSVVASELYKRDRMSPNMRIPTASEVAIFLGSWLNLPTWAKLLIQTPSKPQLPIPSTTLTPAAIQAVNKALGAIATPQSQLKSLGLTKTKQPYAGVIETSDYIPSRDCPARSEGFCSYQPYYGFTDQYMFCEYCDDKKRMPR